MAKILVTAFEAFGNIDTNSSMKVLESLKDSYGENTIFKKVLPVSYKKVPIALKECLETIKPDTILLLGQAGGESRIRVEKIAINFIKASIPDNDGVLLDDILIDEDGNLAYFATIPITRIINILENNNIPCYLSLSAGGYLCNYTMYKALEMTANTEIDTGFIHLPFFDGQQDKLPSMKLEEMIKAIEKVCIVL